MKSKIVLLSVVVASLTLSGCSSYRVSSNVQGAEAVAVTAKQNVIITERSLPAGTYSLIGPLNVSVKKLTIFHKDPTKEQADDAMREKAISMGADAVMEVRYSSGIGMTTWGYMDAEGKAVKLLTQ